MLIILVITLVLAGLRLWGETSPIYKSLAHSFSGGLVGYAVGVHNWVVISCAIILGVVEVYSFAAKIFPAISLCSLLNKIPPVPKK